MKLMGGVKCGCVDAHPLIMLSSLLATLNHTDLARQFNELSLSLRGKTPANMGVLRGYLDLNRGSTNANTKFEKTFLPQKNHHFDAKHTIDGWQLLEKHKNVVKSKNDSMVIKQQSKNNSATLCMESCCTSSDILLASRHQLNSFMKGSDGEENFKDGRVYSDENNSKSYSVDNEVKKKINSQWQMNVKTEKLRNADCSRSNDDFILSNKICVDNVPHHNRIISAFKVSHYENQQKAHKRKTDEQESSLQHHSARTALRYYEINAVDTRPPCNSSHLYSLAQQVLMQRSQVYGANMEHSKVFLIWGGLWREEGGA